MKNILILLLIVSFNGFGQSHEKVNKLFEIGIQKVNEDKFKEALSFFNLSLKEKEIESIKHKIYFERAQLKRRELKLYNSALNDYNLSIKFDPKYTKAYFYRGLLFERNFKDFDAAERDYRTSIRLDPTCGVCYMQLGYLSEKLSPNEMVTFIEEGIKLGIDLQFNGNFINPAPLFGQLAEIKRSNGDYLDAIEDFKNLINNYEDFDSDGDGKLEDASYVSDAYWSISNIYFHDLNDFNNALSFVNKAIEINSKNKDYFTLRAKIKYSINEFESALEDYSTAKATIAKTYFNSIYIPSNFYPYIELDRELDSISLPIELNTRIEINDILGLDTQNEQFFMSVNYNIYSKIKPDFINYKKDTLSLFDFEKKITPFYVGSDRFNEIPLSYQGYDDINITNEVIYSGLIETDFFHNWNLKEYPFDTQKLQFQIKVNIDSSIVKFNQSRFFKSAYNKVKGLKEGYQIDAIEFEEKYFDQTNEETFFPGIIRNAVYPIANYNILVSRSGGWLFIKLFLGSFLSYLISWIVFLIPRKEFDSRISLTVGGIFGAIGNRYFVDSTIPAVQVLTKADMINNMILVLLIFNVLIVIIQKNNKINFGYLEKNKFAMVFTGVSFIVLNALIILI